MTGYQGAVLVIGGAAVVISLFGQNVPQTLWSGLTGAKTSAASSTKSSTPKAVVPNVPAGNVPYLPVSPVPAPSNTAYSL